MLSSVPVRCWLHSGLLENIVQCPRSRLRKRWDNAAVKTQRWRLVGGDLLYDIEAHPSQKANVADSFPQVVTELSVAYDAFWGSLPDIGELLCRHIIGAPKAPETRLNGMDWYRGGAPWHQLHLKRQRQNGVWAVNIARAGLYRFELSWYPREAPTPIGATVPLSGSAKRMSLRTSPQRM
ncbi:MAG: hypothetical protein ACI9R3_004071 [Verrucomicrobiales bacterium]|jgi:hypothetical protein